MFNRVEPGLALRMRNEARRIAEQHRRIAELKEEVSKALSGDSMRHACETFERFAEALGAHFDVEEQLFFPAIHGIDAELARTVDELVTAHGRLREDMAVLLGHFSAGERSACMPLLDALVEEIRTHERTEEWAMDRAGRRD